MPDALPSNRSGAKRSTRREASATDAGAAVASDGTRSTEMHASEREQLILSILADRGFIAFRELDRRVTASPATIRRDLARLELAGKIARVRGGARLARAAEHVEPRTRLIGVPLRENLQRNRGAKAAIGRKAAEFCQDGESIIIDGGSTTLQMCPHLERLSLQVLTNSLNIVSALLPSPRISISVPAGTLFREQNIILSPFEDDGMRRFRASRLFMGGVAVGAHGVMQTDVILVQAERKLMDLADEVIVLVDSSKFEAPNGHVVCALEKIAVLITDDRISDAMAARLESAVGKLVTVPCPDEGDAEA